MTDALKWGSLIIKILYVFYLKVSLIIPFCLCTEQENTSSYFTVAVSKHCYLRKQSILFDD